jgi:3-hydroxybutyrate dehydrogenase
MLNGKVALVTGGASGIGNAIALKLAENGAKVAIASRNLRKIDRAAEDFKERSLPLLPLVMDVRNKAEVERTMESICASWGALHVLVNNAGISGLSMMSDRDDQKWYDIVDTNLHGLYLTTKAALSRIPDHAGGRIINISSVLGKFGVPGYTAYCTTKHGMIGFTRALALEVVHRGITVNAICPGWVDTDMATLGINETAAQLGITPEEFRAQATAAVPIRRFLEAEEVAEFVCYIASNAARGITGQAMNICGGQTMV